MDLIKTAEVLDEFGSLKLRSERPETFVEIAGHPRRETVFSNILAYFLAPDKPHGLGSLVLEAFCEIISESSSSGRFRSGVKVECEVRTRSGKFIDILIETEELILLIENKIDAGINNPFDEYATHLDEISEGREQLKVLLTVNASNAGRREGFVNLTYSRLVAGLESNLGKHISQADTRLLTFFLDFLNTLDNLKRGTRMDPKLIELLAKNQDEFEALLENFQRVKKEMKSKTQELQRELDISGYRNITRRYDRPPYGMYDDLIHDIQISEDLMVSLDSSVFPKGWEIWMWPMVNDQTDLANSVEIKHLLKELKVSADEFNEGWLHPLSYNYEEHSETLEYDAEISNVAEVVQDLIEKICSVSTVK